jgi:hypothetical protein
MIANYELAEMLYELCTKHYDDGIYITKNSWDNFKTKEEFDTQIKTSKKEWFEKIMSTNSKLSFSFRKNDITDNIRKNVGFMWSNPITDVFKAYVNMTIADQDLIRYIELVNNTFPIVQSFIEKSNINHYGSEKFKNAIITYADWFKSMLNGMDKKFYIENMYIHEPTERNNKFVIEYVFNRHLMYNHKNKFKNFIRGKILEKYKPIMSANNWHSTTEIRDLCHHFYDNGKLTSPTNTYMVEIVSNAWNAIASTEDAQFLPIMKKFGGKI